MTTPDLTLLPDGETAQRFERLMAAIRTIGAAEEPARPASHAQWDEAEDGDDL